ncbi:MAG: PAS domain-containing sensor histidine kinase, partial [Patescibacteria group bacterium]
LAFIFSLSLSGVLIIISQTGFNGAGVNTTLAYSLAGGFILVGSLFQFWKPLGTSKLAFYFICFAILGTFLSAFILGYDFSIIYSPWSILFFATYIFFNNKALGIYGAFLLGACLWLIFNWNGVTLENFLVLLISCIFMGLLFLLMAVVWKIANRRAESLEAAKRIEEVGRKRLVALIDSMKDSVIATRTSGEIELYNAATLALFDTNEDLRGKPIQGVLCVKDLDGKQVDIIQLAHDSGKHRTYNDFSLYFSEKDVMRLSVTIAPIRLSFPKDGIAGYAFIISDITKAKTLEEERDELTSVISHELRTPVTIAEGSLSTAILLGEKSGVNQAITSSLQESHDQIGYLAGVINSIATLGRAEDKNSTNISMESFDVDAFAKSIYRQYEPQIKKAGLLMDLDVEPGIGEVYTSKLYLEEILQNLITNAMKYTRQGGVVLRLRKLANGIEFAVIDTGNGISKSDQKKVFQKFYRSEDYRTRETGGTGLGLYVANKLSNKLGTTIDLESRLEHGSTFSFVLPRTK